MTIAPTSASWLQRCVAWLRAVDPFVWVVMGVGLIMKIVTYLLGLHQSAWMLDPNSPFQTWQLLDTNLLEHDLISSVLSLQMQPPLYNLTIGLLLHLPGQLPSHAGALLWFGCYLVLCVTTYLSMVLLAVPRWVALVATLVLVVLDPAQLLYSSNLFYAAPTAALITLSGYTAIRLLRSPTTRNAVFFATSAGFLALFNTSTQPLAVIAILVVLWLLLPSARRVLVRGAIVPVVVLAAWTLQMEINAGTPTTSTWIGMNLAHMTTWGAPPGRIHRMIDDHQLTKMVLVVPFDSLASYGVKPDRQGPAALSEAYKRGGQPNLNNGAYRSVSAESLHNDLRYIELEPGAYATAITRAVRTWLVPTDQYFYFPEPKLGGYRTFYDRYVQLEPHRDNSVYLTVGLFQIPPTLGQLSYLTLGELLAAGIGVPLLAIGWWRARRRLSLALLVLYVLFAESFIVTNLTDVGENNRFRYEAGTLLTIMAVAVVVQVLALARRRFGGESESGVRDRELDALGW